MKQELNYDGEVHCWNGAWAKFEFHAATAKEATDHISHIMLCDDPIGFEWINLFPDTFYYIMFKSKKNKNWKYVYTKKKMNPVEPQPSFSEIYSKFRDYNLLKAENTRLQEEKDKIMRLLEELTPGGSEFHNDPERCANFIRSSREENHYTVTKVIKLLKEEKKELAEMLKYSQNVICGAYTTIRSYSITDSKKYWEDEKNHIDTIQSVINKYTSITDNQQP